MVGVDQNPEVLQTAAARASAAGADHVSFVAGDVRTMQLGGPFDAVIGRLVLMYMSAPARALHTLVELARPAVVAFQDFNLSAESLRTVPTTPLWGTSWDWLVRTVQRAAFLPRRDSVFGVSSRMPACRRRNCGSIRWSPAAPTPSPYAWMAETMRSMLPLILQLGVAHRDEVDLDPLEDRLRADTVGVDAVVKVPELVSAWSTVSP